VVTCGSGFIPTPSSLNHASSPTWNCVINPWTTHPLDSRISGREIIMASRYASRQFGNRTDSLREIRKNVRLFFMIRGVLSALHIMTFRRGRKPISHPNVLPIIDVSETSPPFCIMSPWMPDGNITQYTQMNPGANRLMLVRAHQLEAR
jgi:hypothetical protein